MRLNTSLSELRGAASLCIKCAACIYSATSWPENHSLCPIYDRDNCFAFTGGGLLYLIKALVDRKVDFSQNIAELALSCTGCGACKCGIIRSHMPNEDPMDFIRLLRYEGVKRGFVPKGRASRIYSETKNAAGNGKVFSVTLPKNINQPAAQTVLVAQCLHNQEQRAAFDSAARLLARSGTPVSLYSEDGCCGSTQYDLGFWDNLRPLVEANWKKMEPAKGKEFLFLNPHCQEFVAKRYPQIIGGDAHVKTRHFSEFLVEAFRDGRLKSKKNDQVTVAFHDPCYLGREMGIYDAPREVLSSLSGVTLVEMTRNRQNSYCCGARGMGNYFESMPEFAAKERLKEFRATSADLLVTACSYCKENFRQALPDGEKDKLKDLIELVDERTA